ncbi:hypothetical protein [Bacillus cereus group sp. BfR-BA-01380]|uniref:hypothetical protein n=1 Tax=Bacillus cereus group sp. BfR-BA-01380 TaxID=2920324 RepID=UPI001F5624BE|nr:hypothetical protein [Bacillus cereus group sp. BfR-BA-01380]
MSNKWTLLLILISIIIVFATGTLMPIAIGFKVSMITLACMMIIIFSILIPFDKKYIVRKAGNKIDFTKTKVYFRWNVFDTISVCIAVYACICVQVLSILVSSGLTVQNPYVQFFSNQAPVWTLVASIYLIIRISLTLKGIKEIKKHGANWD